MSLTVHMVSGTVRLPSWGLSLPTKRTADYNDGFIEKEELLNRIQI
jgi:hypothetical protein